MYHAFQSICERLLRIPPEPNAPPGDESSARIFRAAPNYFRYLLLQWGGLTAAFLVGAGFAIVPISIGVGQIRNRAEIVGSIFVLIEIVGIVSLLLQRVFSLVVIRLDFDKRWYVVTDRSMRIREGVFTVREMTITFANIQNIAVSQGPLQRLLGIADLQVETAGGGGGLSNDPNGKTENLHTGWLRGIDNAGEVRNLIQARIKHLKDAGLGDHDDLRHAKPEVLPASPEFIAALSEVNFEAQKLNQALRQG